MNIEILTTKKFVQKLEQCKKEGRLENLAGIAIVGISSKPKSSVQRHDYIFKSFGSSENGWDGQICRLEAISGMELEKKLGEQAVGQFTRDLSEIKIFAMETNGLFYFHSNYIAQGSIYTTKLLLRNIKSVAMVLPALVHGISNDPGTIYSNDEMLLNHIRNIEYLLDSESMLNGNSNLKLDFLGAKKITLLKRNLNTK